MASEKPALNDDEPPWDTDPADPVPSRSDQSPEPTPRTDSSKPKSEQVRNTPEKSKDKPKSKNKLRSASVQDYSVWRRDMSTENRTVERARERARVPKDMRQKFKPVQCPSCTVETVEIDGRIIQIDNGYASEVVTVNGTVEMTHGITTHKCDSLVIGAIKEIETEEQRLRDKGIARAKLLNSYKELSSKWGEITVVDPKTRNRVSMTVDCTRCVAKKDEPCFDLRSKQEGRRNRHVHVERFIKALRMRKQETFIRPDGELCLRDIQPADYPVPAVKLGK